MANIQQAPSWTRSQRFVEIADRAVANQKNNEGLKRYIVEQTDSAAHPFARYTSATRRDVNAQRIFLVRSSNEQIRNLRNDYYALVDKFMEGTASMDEVEASIRTLFQTLININLANGLMTKDCTDSINSIIHSTFHQLRMSTTGIVSAANAREGQEIANQHGLAKDQWFHFNSDFYFFDRELSALISSVADEFFAKHVSSDISSDALWRDTFGGDRSFNTSWASAQHNEQAQKTMLKRNQAVADLRDVRLSPPRDFVLFFADTLQGGIGGTQTHMMILNNRMVTRDATLGGERFTALDFWGDNALEPNVRDFLRNFDIFRNFRNFIKATNPQSTVIIRNV